MTAAQLLYLAIGFAAMRPYPDPTIPNPNLFWYFGLKEPLQVTEMEPEPEPQPQPKPKPQPQS